MAARRKIDHGAVRRVRAVSKFAAFALLFGVTSARAQASGEPESVALKYLAGAGCPSESSFLREVKARIRRDVRWVEQDPSARNVNVRAEVRGGRARGSLEIIDLRGEPTLRQFDAESCGEVASALALVVALALDPNARTEPLPPEPDAPPAPPVSAPLATVAPSAPSAPAEHGRALRVSFGPASTVAGGYAPVAVVAFGATIGLRYESGSLWAPALRASGFYGKTGSIFADDSRASYAPLLGRLDACPLALPLGASVRLEPCVTSELGAVTVSARPPTIESETRRPFWADLGLSAALGWVSAPLFVELEASALVPLTRPKYAFEFSPLGRTQRIYQPGYVFPSALLAVGLEL